MKLKLWLLIPEPNAETDYDETVSAVIYADSESEALAIFRRDTESPTCAPLQVVKVVPSRGVLHSHFHAG